MFLYITLFAVTLFIYFKFLKKSAERISVSGSKFVFITGCDSGFGLNTAKKLDSLGFTVIATCLTDEGKQTLRESCSKNLHVIKMDVTETKQVHAAYEYVKNALKSEEDSEFTINIKSVQFAACILSLCIADVHNGYDISLRGKIEPLTVLYTCTTA